MSHTSAERIPILLRQAAPEPAEHFYEDMADGDIAALLGCTEGTVRSQASRALAKLREIAALQPVRED
ncbi:sigma factor-like helix-turn-helix DNA-binding protein [Dactylosporangium sp. NPDC050688]|uniref:sigma factor-like helix-turn-helix DNA-binding protein n=1 Tax=Dactylosporangium sp. NPDC050688 TaxID=3157217 RepID=UPI0034085DC7